ncbi:hypothetical protein K504DRAFT_180499 [Pleomassaria siparia CBS 279.74]|uniref:Uncharacterized protein n=1 Tax=Pleomassaria siparia CBS 279.74 TaxID=1314801 RepID=A0A6G1JRS9_9PLEO|nr:hypothetical protein K504DRAFT_180499 [Pleomassaria siparia CBS 279.74]
MWSLCGIICVISVQLQGHGGFSVMKSKSMLIDKLWWGRSEAGRERIRDQRLPSINYWKIEVVGSVERASSSIGINNLF